MEELKERIMELEMRFMEQSRFLEELNGVVTETNLRLGGLERENKRLRQALTTMAPEMIESDGVVDLRSVSILRAWRKMTR